MVNNIRYPMPKEMIEAIENKRKILMKNLNLRNIPKTKFVKRYVNLTFNIPDEIKKNKKK